MVERITDEDFDLLDELEVETTPTKQASRTPREERIIAGFEEIQRFVEENGRAPQHGEDRDIFERIYAVRLDRLREQPDCCELLREFDTGGLLDAPTEAASTPEEENDEELLAALGVDLEAEGDITNLTHVRSRAEVQAAEEVAQRVPCPDFDQFKPVFTQVQRELDARIRQTLKYQDNAETKTGDLFILDGQKVLVAKMGEPFTSDYGRPDRRLRVIYDNGTESDLLLRSLQRALNKDKTSRRITNPDLGPMFSDQESEDDAPSGFIYVLRSKSDHPFITANREVIHKIGVTGGSVERRVANAKKDATFLFAEVEIVRTFKLSNLNRNRLEHLLHKFFSPARLDLELKDRFNFDVEPQEWFLVPLPVVEEAISKLLDGSIEHYVYDAQSAQLVKASEVK